MADLKAMFPPLPEDDLLEVIDFLVDDCRIARLDAEKLATLARETLTRIIDDIWKTADHFNDPVKDAMLASIVLGSLNRWLGPDCERLAIGTIKFAAMMNMMHKGEKS